MPIGAGCLQDEKNKPGLVDSISVMLSFLQPALRFLIAQGSYRGVFGGCWGSLGSSLAMREKICELPRVLHVKLGETYLDE